MSDVVELKFNGETHEYIVFGYLNGKSIEHLPNCRYCKGVR